MINKNNTKHMFQYTFFRHFMIKTLSKNICGEQINNQILQLSIRTSKDQGLTSHNGKPKNCKFTGDKIPNPLFVKFPKSY
jgi:hypothetical protein